MKKWSVLCFVFVSIFLANCKKVEVGDTPTTPDATVSVLTTNPWKVTKITDLNGNVIDKNLLPTEVKSFFEVYIYFKEDKTVRALDPVALTVQQGGAWDLLDNSKTLYIDLGKTFKGNYPINKLERARMSLRHTAVYSGLNFDVFLELVPAI
ncbi:hypothetical protein [Runella limosa]|uniref:hypothetical protein n=1 Tax=Runella limosa TaxID=370978 RepID=UPI00048D2CE7|nr:hypothetical protein [Runella limosa]